MQTLHLVTIPFKKIGRLILSAVGAVIAFVSLTITVLVILQALGVVQLVPVLTGSMRPAFAAGDMLVVTSVAPDDVRAGDVIVYDKPLSTNDSRVQKTLIVHRVMRFEFQDDGTRLMYTKGDANPTLDGWTTNVNEADPKRIVTVFPLVGYFAMWATSGFGHSIFVGLSIAVIGFGALWTLWRFALKDDEDDEDDDEYDDDEYDDDEYDEYDDDDDDSDGEHDSEYDTDDAVDGDAGAGADTDDSANAVATEARNAASAPGTDDASPSTHPLDPSDATASDEESDTSSDTSPRSSSGYRDDSYGAK